LEELILRSALGRNVEKTQLIDKAKGVMMMPTEEKGYFKRNSWYQSSSCCEGNN